MLIICLFPIPLLSELHECKVGVISRPRGFFLALLCPFPQVCILRGRFVLVRFCSPYFFFFAFVFFPTLSLRIPHWVRLSGPMGAFSIVGFLFFRFFTVPSRLLVSPVGLSDLSETVFCPFIVCIIHALGRYRDLFFSPCPFLSPAVFLLPLVLCLAPDTPMLESCCLGYFFPDPGHTTSFQSPLVWWWEETSLLFPRRPTSSPPFRSFKCAVTRPLSTIRRFSLKILL